MDHNIDELPSTSRHVHGLLNLLSGNYVRRPETKRLPRLIEYGFKNLSSENNSYIPEEVQILLSWGPRFLPPHVSTVLDYDNTMYFVFKVLMKNRSTVAAHPETCFRQLIIDQYSDLQKFYATKPTLSETELELQHLFQVTSDFLMKNPDLCIVEGDRGSITILIDKSDYHLEIDSFREWDLIDWDQPCIYGLVENDFASKRKAIFKAYQDIVRRLNDVYNAVGARGGSLFPGKCYEMLGDYMREDLPLPYLYGVVRYNKRGVPFKPLWKTLNWYSYPIQKIISFVLPKLLAKNFCRQNVKDITKTVHELYTVPLCEGYEFVKYHIKDIYNQIDVNRIIEIVEILSTGTEYEALIEKLPCSLLVQCLRFTIDKANYFSYKGQVYKPNCGLSEGACDSDLLASLLLDYEIQQNYETLFDSHRIVYWWKNKDEILVYIPTEYVKSFQKNFEEVSFLKVIVKREKIRRVGFFRISFLDLAIVRGNEGLEISLRNDPIESRRMLHYLSNHLITYKRHALRQFIQEVLERTHNRQLESDLTICQHKFYENSYPKPFIEDAFSHCVGKEIEAITNGRPSLPMSMQKLKERISILEDFIDQFNPNGRYHQKLKEPVDFYGL